MDYADALRLTGGLSKPSKMPWWSWSISASECVTGSKLRLVEGSTCSGCYALKGNYMFPNVKEAHARRRAAMDGPQWVDAFVVVLTKLHSVSRKGENRFRWFDAGDLPNLEALEKINEIARRTPQIRHWLPTREIGIVRAFLASGRDFAPNLEVRISAAMVGDTFTRPPFGCSFSTVGRDTDPALMQCPAGQNDNKCGPCDRCWTSVDVNYPQH